MNQSIFVKSLTSLKSLSSLKSLRSQTSLNSLKSLKSLTSLKSNLRTQTLSIITPNVKQTPGITNAPHPKSHICNSNSTNNNR